MKRIFESDKEVDLLINEHTKDTGVKIARLLNNAVRNAFFPRCQTLAVEAAFLLQQAAAGDCDPWVIKQSISRGITWLGKYPVENAELLRTIILHFTRSPWDGKPGDAANEHVSSLFDGIITKIQQSEPDFTRSPVHPYLGNFGEEIIDRWPVLWKDKAAYDALSAIVFTEEPAKPFTWYDAIMILRSIEAIAEESHGIK